MELILADENGKDLRVLDCDFDIEIGGSNTFELTIPVTDWRDDIAFRRRVYVQDTEYGGIISDIETDSSKGEIYVRGLTWRGYLAKRFSKGSYSGDINTVIDFLLDAYKPVLRAQTGTLFNVSETYADYTEIGTIMTDLCDVGNCRLSLEYTKNGYVVVSPVKRGEYTEVSQDSFLEFNIEDDRTGINHLICTDGTNEVNLFADADGNVSTTQTFFGMDELSAVYEFNGDLDDQGEEQLKGMVGKKTLKSSFSSTSDIEFHLGDLVAGKDYITGIVMTKPITKKIIKRTVDGISIEYSVEDNNT